MRASAFVGLGLLVCAWGAAARGAAVAEVVRRVQERFDATADLSARVDQELVVASAGKTLRAKGTVAFKRPGKMRWHLSDGGTQVIVADGTTLWFYQPDEQQVLTAPFRAAFRSSTPISFLTGVGRLGDDFEVALALAVVPIDDVEAAADVVRPTLALYIGGMGARTMNFHYDVIARLGFEAECATIQRLYLDGNKRDAIAAVPTRLCEELYLLGSPAKIKDDVQRWGDTCVSTLLVGGPPPLLQMMAEAVWG